MKIIMETPRLMLREVDDADLEGFFEMDSDPEVARYVGKPPVQHRQESLEIIRFIRSHYELYGTGRWAVVTKETGEFIGWCGVRPMREMNTNGRSDFVDISYRFIRRHWGKGFATEAAKASVDYGFRTMGYTEICSYPDVRNVASQHVLEKIGLERKNEFELEGDTMVWFEAAFGFENQSIPSDLRIF